MNSKHSKLMQVIVVPLVMIGLLIAAWPGVAQDIGHNRFRHPEDFRSQWTTGDLPLIASQRPGAGEVASTNLVMSLEGSYDTIVYQSYRDGNWEIYRLQDGQESRLTFHSAADTRPRLNFNATKIVFSSDRDGDFEIFTMNTDGTSLQQITFNTTSDSAPYWSPDGSRIVFCTKRDGNWEIYVMNADGSTQTRLTNAPSSDDITPVWSPDGGQIAWNHRSGDYGYLYRMNTDGTNQQRQGIGGLYFGNPAWSPNGNYIAYDVDDWSGSFEWNEIWIYDLPIYGYYLAFSHDSFVDHWMGSYSPDSNVLLITRVEYVVIGGYLYIDYTFIEGGMKWSGVVGRYTSSGYDMFPDWRTDTTPPASRVSTLPPYSMVDHAVIRWSGTDTGRAGIGKYDIQYRIGTDGVWNDWLPGTTEITATFSGQSGYTYYFRSRARDKAGNVEVYPSSPDAMTTLYQHVTSGQVLDNREQPVAVVNVQSNPAALNTGVSRHDGTYDLYFAASGVYTLTTTRNNYSQLPPLLNVTVPNSNSLPMLYLPPLDNQIDDSHFESGDLSAWNPIGDLTPTITSTAHTGSYAALLGGSVPSATVTIGPWHSVIEQTVNVSPTIVSGTLSLLYRVESAEPLSDTLAVYVTGVTDTLTLTLPLTATNWSHAWFDLSAWTESTATVKIDFAMADTGREARVIFDEITWGSAIEGTHSVFLPITRR